MKKITDKEVAKKIEKIRNSALGQLYRIGVERNIDPEVTKFLGKALGLDDRFQFHTEIPGYNSDRAFLGVKIRL